MPFLLSFLLQLVVLAVFVIAAVALVRHALQQRGEGPEVPPPATVPAETRTRWVLTMSSSVSPQPVRIILQAADDAVVLGGEGYPLPSPALAGVSLVLRRFPERKGLSVDPRGHAGISINRESNPVETEPYVREGDVLLFAADSSVRIGIEREDEA